ncbi:MAG: RNA methyltransferase [Alphaproteobacteria bacterium]
MADSSRMRGYFGIGVERISKAMNVGAVMRTAHAFGASFLFTIAADYRRAEGERADTSAATGHIPLHEFADVAALKLPRGCALVGIELIDEAHELPSFRHPLQAAYVLGPERGSLSPALVARCDHVVKIPTKFCVNVSVAAAIVMYDRALTLGRFATRPLHAGGPVAPPAAHRYGEPVMRRRARPPKETGSSGR